tara:strand:+ start:2160 stop:3188 length:1029 start_codon:yes stop_codon:yes gene_type:complete
MTKWLIEQFIPSIENRYEPYILRTTAVLGMFVLVVLSFVIVNIQTLLWTSSDWMLSSILPGVIVEATNTERSSVSIGIVTSNSTLSRAAQLKAEHMAKNGYFSHYSPDGISPWHWFQTVGYDFAYAGENLAVHFNDSSDVVRAWMNSPTHRANIMNDNFTEMGVGVAEGVFEGSDTVFVVQLFGAPAMVTAIPQSDVQTESVTLIKEKTPEKEAVFANVPQVASAEEVIVEEEIASNVSTQDGEIVYLGTLTASTPNTKVKVNDATSDSINTKLGWLTQPSVVLQMLYLVLGFFIIVSLLLAIFIEWRRQNPLQIAYGFGLLLMMTGLWYLHDITAGGIVIV